MKKLDNSLVIIALALLAMVLLMMVGCGAKRDGLSATTEEAIAIREARDLEMLAAMGYDYTHDSFVKRERIKNAIKDALSFPPIADITSVTVQPTVDGGELTISLGMAKGKSVTLWCKAGEGVTHEVRAITPY